MHNHRENKDVQIVAVEFYMNDGVGSRGSIKELPQVFAVGINLSASAASANLTFGGFAKPSGGSSPVHVVNIRICSKLIAPLLPPNK